MFLELDKLHSDTHEGYTPLVYFMGIGGMAMGSVAVMMQSMGYRVLGCDDKLYDPMQAHLAHHGIQVLSGYDAQRLARLKPDLVVVGNAMTRGNPEVEYLLSTQAFYYLSLPELIGQSIIGKRKSIVVAGTHGKTTTTALLTHLLHWSGRQAGYMIGGLPYDLPGGAQFGRMDECYVIEGDEYDSAFFDKRSKFIHYRPQLLLVNNIEFDHADIFRDLADVQRTFQHVAKLVPEQGHILLNADDSACAPLAHSPWCTVWQVGLGQQAHLSIHGFRDLPETLSSQFELHWGGQPWALVQWPLMGLFNARNAAMAALAWALAQHPSLRPGMPAPSASGLQAALAAFRGVRRRQEVLLRTQRHVIMEDFGHHPTAIHATLQALRVRYPGHHLAACFEAKSNTAQMPTWSAGFTEALSRADSVWLAPLEPKHPGTALLDTARIAHDLRQQGLQATAFNDYPSMEQALGAHCLGLTEVPQVVCFFSNGSFASLHKRLSHQLQALCSL
jgi:UDP-N-acetylmuramate: L-alanyl-gamma-D-glutamyl-meso-diaminopimelate ligase